MSTMRVIRMGEHETSSATTGFAERTVAIGSSVVGRTTGHPVVLGVLAFTFVSGFFVTLRLGVDSLWNCLIWCETSMTAQTVDNWYAALLALMLPALLFTFAFLHVIWHRLRTRAVVRYHGHRLDQVRGWVVDDRVPKATLADFRTTAAPLLDADHSANQKILTTTVLHSLVGVLLDFGLLLVLIGVVGLTEFGFILEDVAGTIVIPLGIGLIVLGGVAFPGARRLRKVARDALATSSEAAETILNRAALS